MAITRADPGMFVVGDLISNLRGDPSFLASYLTSFFSSFEAFLSSLLDFLGSESVLLLILTSESTCEFS